MVGKKNSKFRRQYVIDIEGVTTNNFADESFDSYIRAVIEAYNNQHKQVKVILTICTE